MTCNMLVIQPLQLSNSSSLTCYKLQKEFNCLVCSGCQQYLMALIDWCLFLTPVPFTHYLHVRWVELAFAHVVAQHVGSH